MEERRSWPRCSASSAAKLRRLRRLHRQPEEGWASAPDSALSASICRSAAVVVEAAAAAVAAAEVAGACEQSPNFLHSQHRPDDREVGGRRANCSAVAWRGQSRSVSGERGSRGGKAAAEAAEAAVELRLGPDRRGRRLDSDWSSEWRAGRRGRHGWWRDRSGRPDEAGVGSGDGGGGGCPPRLDTPPLRSSPPPPPVFSRSFRSHSS